MKKFSLAQSPPAATLGETLDGTPGISSTCIGPNASRPVIRGVDGDRIPREAQFDAQGGVGGKADFGLASGTAEKSAGFLLEAGTDWYALHRGAFNRHAGDVAAPAMQPHKPMCPQGS